MDTRKSPLMSGEREKLITEGLMDEKFNMFMETVDEHFRNFVSQINEYLTGNGLSIPMTVIRNV